MQFLFTKNCLRCKVFFTKFMQDEFLFSTDSNCVFLENMEILKHLGVAKAFDKNVAKSIINKEPKKLIMTIESVKELGFAPSDIETCPAILMYSPKIIDHRFKALEEGGFFVNKITLPLISHFFKLISKPVVDLKNDGYIGKNENITRNILSYCDLPSNMYPPERGDSCQFKEIQEITIQSYLCWKFSISIEKVQKVFKIYPDIRFRSMRLIMENYIFLKTQVGLPKEVIRKNLYLLHDHPHHYKEVLEKTPTIGIQPIREVIKTYPKLLMRPAEYIVETIDILKEFSIPPESLNMYPDIMFLSPKTVRKRLEYLHRDPNFQPFFCNPRICKAIVYFNNLTKRFEQLNDTKWRTKTFDMLSAQKDVFQGRLKMGSDRSRGNDIVHYLHKELKMKRRLVREKMKMNPFWCCVPLTTITSTLQLLREVGVKSSQICDALTILLYPKEDVCKLLHLVDSQPEVDCCRIHGTREMQPDLLLPLLLYYLERPFHFSGNGVWDTQAGSVIDNAPDHTSLIEQV